MKVSAKSHYCFPLKDEGLEDLSDLVQEATGKKIRRTDRFIDLALLGSNKCISGMQVPGATGIYMGTGQGNLSETITVLHQILMKGQSPLPFNFINTLSNTAGFYVANSLNLDGPNILVSQKEFLFEGVLEAASVDLERENTPAALIGNLDEGILPVGVYRKRQKLPEGTDLSECTSWFFAHPDTYKGTSLAEITYPRQFNSEEELKAFLSSPPHPYTHFAFSYTVTASIKVALQKSLQEQGLLEFDYLTGNGYCDSITAFGIGSFIQEHPGNSLVHINQNSSSVFKVFEVHVSQHSEVL